MEEAPSPSPVVAAPCWSSVVKKEAPAVQQEPLLLQTERVLENARNRHGISVAVIDANAVIEAGDKLHGIADKFVSVPEVMEEIRDPVSRHKLSFLPFSTQTMEPSPESINKGILSYLPL